MQDTIFSLATPVGQSAIAVFRISGAQAAVIGTSYQEKH